MFIHFFAVYTINKLNLTSVATLLTMGNGQGRTISVLTYEGQALTQAPPDLIQRLRNDASSNSSSGVQKVSLSHNKLASLETLIPKDLGMLHSIAVLELSDNILTEIPECLTASLDNLTRLDLSYNNIAVIPAHMGRLVGLQALLLSHNVVATLPRMVAF